VVSNPGRPRLGSWAVPRWSQRLSTAGCAAATSFTVLRPLRLDRKPCLVERDSELAAVAHNFHESFASPQSFFLADVVS
jgi:hypothetical protein